MIKNMVAALKKLSLVMKKNQTRVSTNGDKGEVQHADGFPSRPVALARTPSEKTFLGEWHWAFLRLQGDAFGCIF